MLLRTRFGGAALAAQGGSLASKLLLSIALLGSAAGVAGLGTYATFTSSTPAESQVLAAGTTSIQLGQDGTRTGSPSARRASRPATRSSAPST